MGIRWLATSGSTASQETHTILVTHIITGIRYKTETLLQSSERHSFGGCHFLEPRREVQLFCKIHQLATGKRHRNNHFGRQANAPYMLWTIMDLTPLVSTQVALLPSSTPPPPSPFSTLVSIIMSTSHPTNTKCTVNYIDQCGPSYQHMASKRRDIL